MTNRSVTKDERCQGMALILVVGMLALMVTIAVAFSIFMRTEQIAAGSFYNDVIARQYLQAGLVRALEAIDANVMDDLYPKWDVWTSRGQGGSFSNAFTGPITNWVPSGVFVSTNVAEVVPEWITLGSVPGFGGPVAFVVLNCSGLLDANYAGGGGTRAYGSSPDEIRLLEVTNRAAFTSERLYATQQELRKVGNETALSGPPHLLVTHSAFPNLYEGGVDRGLADVSGTNLTRNKSSIISNLEASGISAENSSFVFDNLLDYVDSDNVPTNLASPCTEKVPMINEVWVSPSIFLQAAGMCLVNIPVSVEWIYPFLTDSADSFTIVAEVKVTGIENTKTNYVPASSTQSLPSLYAAGGGSAPVVVEFPVTTGSVPWSSNDVVRLVVRVGVKVKNSKGEIVDQVPSPYNANNFLTVTNDQMRFPGALPGGVLAGEKRGFECVDPRFNWDTTPEEQWYAYDDFICPEGSEGEMNKRTLWWVYQEVTKNADTNFEMYVADGPLRNVGELSYLLRGKRWDQDKWNSIKIVEDQRSIPIDTVLDHFVLSDLSIRHGLLNVNARSKDVWAAIFRDMPLDLYPGDTSAPKVSEDEAARMADIMVNYVAASNINVSDVGLVPGLVDVVKDSCDHPLRERAVVRNISSLLDTRQQYFIVLLYAMPRKMVKEGVVADIQAVAEVWRDPLRNDLGEHAKIVRSFTIMQDLTMP